MEQRKKLFFGSFLKRGITQLGLVVEDVDKWVEKLYRVLGTTPWHYYIYDKSTLKIMKRNGKKAEFGMISAVANLGSLRLELVKPLKGDMVYNEFVKKYGYDKVQHLGIVVDNIEEALKTVRKAGIEITMEGSGYGLDGDGYFAYLDTEELIGITLELMERPKRRRKPFKTYP